MGRYAKLVASTILALSTLCVGVSEAKPTSTRSEASTALQDYVQRPDKSYAWQVRQQGKIGAGSYAELILTSQTWHDIAWKHQLFIYRPANMKDSAQVLLLIDGGSWSDSLEAKPDSPDSPPEKVRIMAALSDIVGTPVAILRQVPRQPMFDGRKEDQIIALTFTKYFETGESDWPLLLPMVKSAVRAMDAVQEFCHQECNIEVRHFTVTGASKRGWTTWLTAATDPRVNALAPMVINMLNMPAHDKLQVESFGAYSEQIQDYTDRGLQKQMLTKQGDALRKIVDPYLYRQQLLQPKLIILATNDAYWPVDSLNLYWNELQGDKYLLYVPNNGHGITDYPRIVGTVAALQRSVIGGKPLPKLTWHYDEQADPVKLELTTAVVPSAVRQWTATADTRDFRKSSWTSTSVAANSDDGHKFVAKLARPNHGFNAMFLEAEFPDDPMPFDLSTTLNVFGANATHDSADHSSTKPAN